MIEFRTKVELSDKDINIHHSDRMMMLGSCFVENIGKKLTDSKFDCDINPFGILYNPLSISEALYTMLEGRKYNENNLLEKGGTWFSLMHHSSFSSHDKNECLERINHRIEQGGQYLRESRWVIITFGTARVYEWKESHRIVGNCHKLPERMFSRRLLDVVEIVDTYKDLLEKIREVNPQAEILFTVSPIRHAKDGMHGNQINKASLLLAIDQLCDRFSYCHYFPSYEIMMDELRDYRFYADDMLHPSSMAIEYIWERLSKECFSADTLKAISQWEEIEKGLSHRPFNPTSEAHKRFLSQILLKIERIKEKFPYLDTQKEIDICRTLLKK